MSNDAPGYLSSVTGSAIMLPAIPHLSESFRSFRLDILNKLSCDKEKICIRIVLRMFGVFFTKRYHLVPMLPDFKNVFNIMAANFRQDELV